MIKITKRTSAATLVSFALIAAACGGSDIGSDEILSPVSEDVAAPTTTELEVAPPEEATSTTEAPADDASTVDGEEDVEVVEDVASEEASDPDESVPVTPVDPISYHEGYWTSDVTADWTLINDMHVDLDTRRATVYAQVVASDAAIISPPQLGPDECTTENSQTVCFHPNGVYLNGSGQELNVADGTGNWWIKHSWIVDGEGYENCEVLPLFEDWAGQCRDTVGVLLDDGVTMSMEVGEWGEPGHFNNLRAPQLDAEPITYQIETYRAANTDPIAGEIDLSRNLEGVLSFDCQPLVSEFDGQIESCPVNAESDTDAGESDAPVSSDASGFTAIAVPEGPCGAEPTTLTTDAGEDFVRTPDECFDDLPDWPYDAGYVEINGLRQAYIDEGDPDGEVILLLHGNPTWSYMYRKVIPVLVDAGYRVVAMDHLGMGRSDKPVDIEAHSYVRHGDRLLTFIEDLDLQDINLFVHDWGSLIGLRIAGLNTDRFARISLGSGNLPVVPDGAQPFAPVEDPNAVIDITTPYDGTPDVQVPFYSADDPCSLNDPYEFLPWFTQWMTWSMKGATFSPANTVEPLTWFDVPDDELAAYDAPFPRRIYMAAPRSFPSLSNTVEAAGDTARAWEQLAAFDGPVLTVWGNNDNLDIGACGVQDNFVCNVAGAAGQPHARLPEASHYIADDQGEELGNRLVSWIEGDDAYTATYQPTCTG